MLWSRLGGIQVILMEEMPLGHGFSKKRPLPESEGVSSKKKTQHGKIPKENQLSQKMVYHLMSIGL